jgi:hypothetical protein
MNYKDWVDYRSRLEGRDVSQDEQDYDLESFYNDQKQATSPGHLPDTYKKPNHPTFSDESRYHVPVLQQGGTWNEDGQFSPSSANIQNMGPANLQRYFNEVEGADKLNLPENERFSKIRTRLKK